MMVMRYKWLLDIFSTKKKKQMTFSRNETAQRNFLFKAYIRAFGISAVVGSNFFFFLSIAIQWRIVCAVREYALRRGKRVQL